LRKVSIDDARVGMLLARDVYSWSGVCLLETGNGLDASRLEMLRRRRVPELVVQDRRADDIVIVPTIPEDEETEITAYLRKLVRRNRGLPVAEINLEMMTADRLIKMLVQDLANTFLSEIVMDGGRSVHFYDRIHSVRMAILSLMIGRELGYASRELVSLGVAALLADVGYLLLPDDVLQARGSLNGEKLQQLRMHPLHSQQILAAQRESLPVIARAVAEHHERGNGSGFPRGLRAAEISPLARIIAVTDTYHELISLRPGGKPFLPVKVAAFIAERGGREFDRQVVTAFLKVVPMYSRGTIVALKDGEIGVITRGGVGLEHEPVVRVCINRYGQEPRKIYDLDMAEARLSGQKIVAIDVNLPEPPDDTEADAEAAAELVQSTARSAPDGKWQAEKTRIPIFDKTHISVAKIKDWQQLNAGVVTAPGEIPAAVSAEEIEKAAPLPVKEAVAAVSSPVTASEQPVVTNTPARREEAVDSGVSPEITAAPVASGQAVRVHGVQTRRVRVVRRRIRVVSRKSKSSG
jgi:HD-GYP domain-containing protein (c-di-GMP phosphodiesterase class II)